MNNVKQEIDSQAQRTDLWWLMGRVGRGMERLGLANVATTYIYIYMINNRSTV